MFSTPPYSPFGSFEGEGENATLPCKNTEMAPPPVRKTWFLDYETIEASSKLCIRFLSNLCKNDLYTVLGRNLFSIANDCSVNPSDLSKMLVKKQMKHLMSHWNMNGKFRFYKNF